jgi:hypothetical protein
MRTLCDLTVTSGMKKESQQGDSNPRPTDYESVALAD